MEVGQVLEAVEQDVEGHHWSCAVWRCGWCKGFIEQGPVSDMILWVHTEEPVTVHEVLPYCAPE